MFKKLGVLILLLSSLSVNVFAITIGEYMSWLNPSHSDYLWRVTVEDNEHRYSPLESFSYTFNGVAYVAQTSGTYGGRVALTIKEYVQPAGLPGYNYMYIHDYSSDSEIRVNQGVKSYSVPASYANNLIHLKTDTDSIGEYHWWLLELPNLSQNDKVVQIDSCFVYLGNTYCKSATVTINGLF